MLQIDWSPASLIHCFDLYQQEGQEGSKGQEDAAGTKEKKKYRQEVTTPADEEAAPQQSDKKVKNMNRTCILGFMRCGQLDMSFIPSLTMKHDSQPPLMKSIRCHSEIQGGEEGRSWRRQQQLRPART